MSGKIANNTIVPNLYMTGTQYSRLFALAYLDQHYRSGGPESECLAYAKYMERTLTAIKESTLEKKKKLVASLLGGEGAKDEFFKSIPDGEKHLDVFYKQLEKLTPCQSFHVALEENPLWAATNSIVYTIAIHFHDFLLLSNGNDNGARLTNNIFSGAELTNNISERDVFSKIKCSDMTKTLILNMLFLRVMKVDDIPSVLEGYSFNVIDDTAKQLSRAITLPSNATTC